MLNYYNEKELNKVVCNIKNYRENLEYLEPSFGIMKGQIVSQILLCIREIYEIFENEESIKDCNDLIKETEAVKEEFISETLFDKFVTIAHKFYHNQFNKAVDILYDEALQLLEFKDTDTTMDSVDRFILNHFEHWLFFTFDLTGKRNRESEDYLIFPVALY